MSVLEVRPLSDDLPFGARITGVTLQNVTDPEVRADIQEQFVRRGVLVFQEIEASNEIHLALSEVIGPPQDHAMGKIPTVNKGVVDLDYKSNIFEINGKQLNGYVPWHFDACYVAKLNRGGVLRGIDIPPEGGLTGFVDGIQLYHDISPELRGKFENRKVLYHPKRMWANQRFDMPEQFRVVSLAEGAVTLLEQAENQPRSIQPAVWERETGERVLHVCPWQADGIYGEPGPEGDALLEELFQEIKAKMLPYWHKWEPTDMLAWDNWRCLHAVSGNDPKYNRRMFRTTIEGDYGLGSFENDANRESSLKFDV